MAALLAAVRRRPAARQPTGATATAAGRDPGPGWLCTADRAEPHQHQKALLAPWRASLRPPPSMLQPEPEPEPEPEPGLTLELEAAPPRSPVSAAADTPVAANGGEVSAATPRLSGARGDGDRSVRGRSATTTAAGHTAAAVETAASPTSPPYWGPEVMGGLSRVTSEPPRRRSLPEIRSPRFPGEGLAAGARVVADDPTSGSPGGAGGTHHGQQQRASMPAELPRDGGGGYQAAPTSWLGGLRRNRSTPGSRPRLHRMQSEETWPASGERAFPHCMWPF
jgi:hypothetical protein